MSATGKCPAHLPDRPKIPGCRVAREPAARVVYTRVVLRSDAVVGSAWLYDVELGWWCARAVLEARRAGEKERTRCGATERRGGLVLQR